MKRSFFVLFFATLCAASAFAQPRSTPRPLIGAQIWIEPGQTPQQIDGWFKQLADSHMPVCRLFMMWNYMEGERDHWDFSLYDQAFRSAEKYGVRIVATLTPNHGPASRGFWYESQGANIIATPERLREGAMYIDKVVNRYKSSPALDTWMLMNEPGQEPTPDPLAITDFRVWLQKKYGAIAALNSAWITDFTSFSDVEYDKRWASGGWAWPTSFVDWYTFWREHMTAQLNWIAQQIRQHDPNHPLHVNPHALVYNLADHAFDLPAWRPFLNSLGASIHPAWHFGLLRRDQFALGVSYVTDLIHGASEPHPYWVTELQGGNNIYSSVRPMDPTADDIAQWVWTGIGAGADRVIFWLLNWREQGGEAAEWSLLDFQGHRSERLTTASQIAQIADKYAAFFSEARAVQAPVTIVLSPETMTLQERFRSSDFPGRDRNAHLIAALGMYEALAQLGVPARVKYFDDFDWLGRSATRQLVIVPHVTAMTVEQARNIEAFVRNGNTALITGLTGFYSPDGKAWPVSQFPLQSLLGATYKEVRFIDEFPPVTLTTPALTLPSHLWISEIQNHSAGVIGSQSGWVTAVRAKAGAGEAVWIPSLIGMAGWLHGNRPLTALLKDIAAPFAQQLPFRYPDQQPGCLMRTLQNGDAFATVITNGGTDQIVCRVQHRDGAAPQQLWGAAVRNASATTEVPLGARATTVLLWK